MAHYPHHNHKYPPSSHSPSSSQHTTHPHHSHMQHHHMYNNNNAQYNAAYAQQHYQQYLHQQQYYQHQYQHASPNYYSPYPVTSTSTTATGSTSEPPTVSLERMKADAKTLFIKPGRNTRPPKMVVIMRGLPGSGKTYYAQLLKDYEAKYGAASPRIFCLDDYFMAEVDKEEEDPETGIKRKIKALEYQYEAEMEEPYQASLLKQFRKCLTESFFPFIIVDNINARIVDFEQYCTAATMAGYAVFILQTPQCDLKLLAQRNVHNKSLETIEKLNAEWQDTPFRYTLLNIENFGTPDDITVVDMTEDDAEDSNKQETKSVDESKWAKLVEDRPKKTDKEKEKENDNKENKVKGNEPRPSSMKKAEMENLMSAYYKKKVRWADLEYQKEIDRGFAIGGSYKRKRFAHDSDSEEENPAPKQQKATSFLDKVKEEQENFKVHLLAKQALEQVKYIGPKETEGHLEEELSESDDSE